MNRSQFLQRTLMGGTAALVVPYLSHGQRDPERPPAINLEIVKEFVGVSHGKFDRCKEMLENDPHLLHVSYDWGAGDHESGIEAAGHVGNREIAAYLLGKGARYNIYLACMLGHLETVKNVLTFNPGLLNSMGPHGFTMLHHANKGGEPSKPVVDYLTSLGAKETRIFFYTKG